MLRLVKQFAPEAMFPPDELAILCAAFDDAWQQLERSGVRFDSDDQREHARRVLGKKIIDEASKGERDRARLRDSALLDYSRAQVHRNRT